MSGPSGVVCMFCGEAIQETGADPLCVDLVAPDSAATGRYWCHSECLTDSVHYTVPLYLLSLRTDRAVYGRRGEGEA